MFNHDSKKCNLNAKSHICIFKLLLADVKTDTDQKRENKGNYCLFKKHISDKRLLLHLIGNQLL